MFWWYCYGDVVYGEFYFEGIGLEWWGESFGFEVFGVEVEFGCCCCGFGGVDEFGWVVVVDVCVWCGVCEDFGEVDLFVVFVYVGDELVVVSGFEFGEEGYLFFVI